MALFSISKVARVLITNPLSPETEITEIFYISDGPYTISDRNEPVMHYDSDSSAHAVQLKSVITMLWKHLDN